MDRFVVGDIGTGLDNGSAVSSEEAWVARGNYIYRMSKNDRLYSNDYISRLVASSAPDVTNALAQSGIDLSVLAADKAQANLLQNFITVKNLTKVREHADYSAIVNYLTSKHLQARQNIGGRDTARSYTAGLINPTGGVLKAKEMQANYSNTGIFIATDQGLFILDSVAFSPVLLSRQETKTNIIALNNKLLFVNKENVLIDLRLSDERRGYVEDKAGKYQTELYQNVDRLVFNPVENALYGINDKGITRAITDQDKITGFSTYKIWYFLKLMQDIYYLSFCLLMMID